MRRLLASCALSSIVLALAACDRGSAAGGEPASRPPPEVGYVVLEAETVPLTVELAGRTTAFEISEVRPQVSGVIVRRLYVEGSRVRAGDTLYQIDPRTYEAAAVEAQADLRGALAAEQAAVARVERIRQLAATGVVSRQDLADTEAQAGQASAEVERARGALAQAQLNLRFTQVPAPIAGRIGRSLATTGALVTQAQAQPLAVIQRLDPIFVDIQQSSAELLELRRALESGGRERGIAEVRLVLEDGSEYAVPGELQFAESLVDASTGTVTLRARFPNPDGLLLPGMYVRARVTQSRAPDAILAPQQGIARDAKGNATALVVATDGRAVQRTVATERTVGDRWLVTRGLQPGDRLIVEGLARVRPGEVVRAVPAGAPPGAAGEPGRARTAAADGADTAGQRTAAPGAAGADAPR